MVKALRLVLLGLVLAVACPPAAAPQTLAAQRQRPTDLQLRRWKFRVDDRDNRYLWVMLTNTGTKPVRIAGIAASQWGPWLVLNQQVAPDEIVRGQVRLGKQPPTAVWVDCSEGLIQFDLPKK